MSEKKGWKIKMWDPYMETWLMNSICGEAARRADNAGNLTRAGALSALENMKDWTAGGLYGKALDFAQMRGVEGKDAIRLPKLCLLDDNGFGLISPWVGHVKLTSLATPPAFIVFSPSFR
jgi:hypothetical protein